MQIGKGLFIRSREFLDSHFLRRNCCARGNKGKYEQNLETPHPDGDADGTIEELKQCCAVLIGSKRCGFAEAILVFRVFGHFL